MHDLANTLATSELIGRTGQVAAVRGHMIESTGPAAQIGERCRIEAARSNELLEAEVVGFNRGVTVLMPLGSVEGISSGDRVTALGHLPQIPVGPELLGRVVDPFGKPVDDGCDILIERRRGLGALPPPAMRRQRVNMVLETDRKSVV